MNDATATVETTEVEEAAPTVAAAPKPKRRTVKATPPPSERAMAQAKQRRTAPSKTHVIEIEEDLFVSKETMAVRLDPDQEPYAVWNCADSPGEAIRVNDGTVLRFRNGLLECRDENDDAAVAHANGFAGGKYIRAEAKYLDDPFEYQEKSGRVTRWYSKRAYERYVALHPRDN